MTFSELVRYSLADMGDRGDLAVDKRCRPAKGLETRSLVAVPRCGNLVIRKERKWPVSREIGFVVRR